MDSSKIEKGKYKGKKCFIIGSGPSIAYKDLKFLKNYFIIALNVSILTLDLHKIEPNIVIVADKYQYPRFKGVFEKLTHKKDIKKVIVASACETFPSELIDKNTLFFPKKLQQEKPSFSKYPLEQGFSRGKTVAYDAIQLAYYLGFKEINIIGMDMDFDKNWGINGHSYEIEKNPKFPDTKFAKSHEHEIKRGAPGNPEYLKFIKNCMNLAREAFEKDGKEIFNDSNSKLNVFKKKDLIKNRNG